MHGALNLPSSMPVHASRLYSRNVLNLLKLMIVDGAVLPNLDDEVLDGCCLTHDGADPQGVAVIDLLTIFVLAVFVGFEVVSKVSTILHTPLMSGANAIHGVILVGAILITGSAESTLELVLGLLAVFLATVNVVGGFVVTDRMLEMFKK